MARAPTFDTIILLTGPAEQPALAAALRGHRPDLTIHPAASMAELGALAPHFPRARLIGFVTSVVVPGHVLQALGFGAYNFHPGPPDYPGRFPAHFAIYERARAYGATMHAMIERVDAGPIVGVSFFPMPPRPTVESLETVVFSHLAKLFWHHAKTLATQAAPLVTLPIPWHARQCSSRSLAALCEIAPDIAEDELERRIAAFGDGHYGLHPTITLHGHAFRFVKTQPDVAIAAPDIGPTPRPLLGAEPSRLPAVPAQAVTQDSTRP
jgi:methionyl-tRNA formyltransferase